MNTDMTSVDEGCFGQTRMSVEASIIVEDTPYSADLDPVLFPTVTACHQEFKGLVRIEREGVFDKK